MPASTAPLLPAGVDLRARAWYNPALLSRVYNVPAVIITIAVVLLSLAIWRFRASLG